MARQIGALYAFNRGLISPLGLGRVDQKRVALGAEVMTNWIPRVLGNMAFRPGLKFIGECNGPPRFLKFVFSTTDTALIELTDFTMRVWVDDALIERPVVATTITNDSFASDLSGWTDDDESGGTSFWVLDPVGAESHGYMAFESDGTAYATRYQLVTVSPTDYNIEHAIRIVVTRGPVVLRVGSSLAGDEYISETTLGTGVHSLALTPIGDFYIQFQSRDVPLRLISQCSIEAVGTMEVTTPWSSSVLDYVRYDQSADVIYVACQDIQQRKIERRGVRSWSIVLYAPTNGPFKLENITPTTLEPSGITGNIGVTSSVKYFRPEHVGSLFAISSEGQTVERSISAQNTFTNSIEVTGTGTGRNITIIIADTFIATVTLQYSTDDAVWFDVPGKTWTAPTTEGYVDTLDNQIIFYRLGVKTADFGSGTVEATLSFPAGSIRGVVRITEVQTETFVDAEVLTDLGGSVPTAFWQEGQWSDNEGWPTAVRLFDGRLWFAGKDGITGSVSDAFEDFDEQTVGDSGPINRTIGSGPVDTINWILGLQRMILGAQGSELSVRASSLDEPLTPTNFGMKTAGTQGSAPAEAWKIDQRGVFVQRSSTKVYSLTFNTTEYDYAPVDMTALVPELGLPGIVRTDVQRQPDTRVHCIRSDGTAMLAVTDAVEDVTAWCEVETDGEIVDVVTLPGQGSSTEDQVYYVVKRVVVASAFSDTIGVMRGAGEGLFVGSGNQQGVASVTGAGQLLAVGATV